MKKSLLELEQNRREILQKRSEEDEQERLEREQRVQAELAVFTAKAVDFIAGQEDVHPDELTLHAKKPSWLRCDGQALHGFYGMKFELHLEDHLPIIVKIEFGLEKGKIATIDYCQDFPWSTYHYDRHDYLYCGLLAQALVVAADQYQVKLEQEAQKAKVEAREQDRRAAQARLFEQVAAHPVALALIKLIQLILAISEERESLEAMAEDLVEALDRD